MNADDAAIAVVLCAFTDEDDLEEKAALLHFDEIFLLFQNHLYNIRDGANEGVTSFYHDSYSSQ